MHASACIRSYGDLPFHRREHRAELCGDEPPAKRGFYEKVTDVNISYLFSFRWRLCFSFRLRRMLFSTVFLYALCMGLRPCAGWGPMEKSKLPVFGRPR